MNILEEIFERSAESAPIGHRPMHCSRPSPAAYLAEDM
jgi:hypothetical protein